QVQSELRVPQVIEHTHEEHEIEAALERGEVIDARLKQIDPRGDVELADRPPGLREKMRIHVDADDMCAPSGEFDGVEACVAPDIECPPSAQVCGEVIRKLEPLVSGKVPQRMIRGSLRPVRQMEIVE